MTNKTHVPENYSNELWEKVKVIHVKVVGGAEYIFCKPSVDK